MKEIKENEIIEASFEASTAVMFQVEVFWVVTPCSVVVKMEAAWTSENLVSITTLHGVTTQKTSN